MKAITFSFVRDWDSVRSIPGTSETERLPAGRHTDHATYVVDSEAAEPVARAQLLRDFQFRNPTDIQVSSTTDIQGIVHCTRRLV